MDELEQMSKEEGGEIFEVLILFELQTSIEQFLLLARSLPDYVSQAGSTLTEARRLGEVVD